MQEPTIFNNRYQILAKIGQGGLAEVYRAQDVALGRLVAVKALRPEYVVDPAFLVRFHREAQSAANLAHPNIVAVYDFGQDQGRPYIVMEYVPGQDLRTLLEQSTMLSVHQAVEIGVQVCAGVGHAHRSGLVHGDLKPGNVIVRADGQAKVADFGLARALGESAMDEEGELVWGTPAYFAPEQAAGGTLVPATDVYAIGVILYEALTGQLPFTGDDDDVARQHVYETPLPVNKVNTRIPSQLAHIVDKALQKKPEDRFATADGMGQALDVFRQQADRNTGGVGLPGRSILGSMPAHKEGEASVALPAVDWVAVMLGFIAVIAVAGLVPLYATVYRAYLRTEVPGRPTATATIAPGQVRVPDVVGALLEDGRQALQGVGLKLEVVGQANHPTIPAFAIVEQTVRAGTAVAEGTTIGVVVSQGPRLVEVPSVIDKSLGQAQKVLQSQDLIPETHHAWSQMSPGTVTGQDPPAGSLVQSRSLITLTVSSGTQVPVGARLGDSILLLTYELQRLDYQPGQLLRLTLAWQAIAPPKQGYVVFVHLTRPDGSVVAQHDGLPSGGEVPTDKWSPGVRVVDSHDLTIPSDTTAGEYWLRVGMYGGGGRLKISDAGQVIVADDALVLSPIQVE